MQIGLDEDQQSLRKQLREYYARILTPEVVKALETPGITPTHKRSPARWAPMVGSVSVGPRNTAAKDAPRWSSSSSSTSRCGPAPPYPC